jgi:hypothetical protein
MPTSPTTPSTSVLPGGLSRERAWGLASGAAVVVGSFGPWATFGPFSKGGLDGDGVITLVLGLVVLAAVWLRRAPLGVLVAGALVALIGIIDTIDVAGSQVLSPSPGWGVLLTAAAGLSVVAWAALEMARGRRSSPAGPTPPTA